MRELTGAILVTLFLVGLTTLLVVWIGGVSAAHKANVWNRCHPSVPITAQEAFWIKDLQVDECEEENK